MTPPLVITPNGEAADQGDGYNIIDAKGLDIGMVWNREDAEAICKAVNTTAEQQ